MLRAGVAVPKRGLARLPFIPQSVGRVLGLGSTVRHDRGAAAAMPVKISWHLMERQSCPQSTAW